MLIQLARLKKLYCFPDLPFDVKVSFTDILCVSINVLVNTDFKKCDLTGRRRRFKILYEFGGKQNKNY